MGSAGVGCSGLRVVSKYLRVARRGRLTKLGYMVQYSTAQLSTAQYENRLLQTRQSSGRGEEKLERPVKVDQHLHDRRLKMQTTP